MSNKAIKLPKPKKQRRKAQSKAQNTPIWRRVFSWAITVIGLIAAGLTFLPRVTVAISDPPDSSEPFSSSITVTNTGYIPLRGVSSGLSINNLWAGGRKIMEGDDKYDSVIFITPDKVPPRDLGLDDRFTFAFNDFFTGRSPMDIADMAIIVDYRLPIIPIKRRKIFPFFARRQSNGNFYWYAKTAPN